jgi:hypothetical protein
VEYLKIQNSSQSETRIALGGHICWWNGTKWRNFIEDLIDAYCQVWFPLAKLFQRKRLKYKNLLQYYSIVTVEEQIRKISNFPVRGIFKNPREIIVNIFR